MSVNKVPTTKLSVEMTEEIRRLYVDEKLSIPQVSERTGVKRSTVRRSLMIGGHLRSRGDGVRLASSAGRLRGRPKGIAHSPEARENMRRSAIARGERTAKGVSVKPNGYVEITRGPNKGRLQHIVVMEEHIGRRLHPDEVVHHINRDRADNRLENLQLMTRSAHTELHRREDG